MELKTLKDLEIGMHVGDCKRVVDENREVGSEWTTSIIFAGNIKAEAIKWLTKGQSKVNDFILDFFDLNEEDLK